MAFIEVRHEETPDPALAEAGSLQELRDVVRGEIVTPGDSGFDEASRIWNGAHDGHRPAPWSSAVPALPTCAPRSDSRVATSWRSPSAAAATASPASRPSTAGS